MTEQRPLDTASPSMPDVEPMQSDFHEVDPTSHDHTHLALLYETRSELFASAVPFLRAGLERGEQCLYIADETPISAVVEALETAGIDVEAAREAGGLSLLSTHERCGGGSEFDPAAMVERWEDHIVAANEEGYEGFRIAGEAAWELGTDGLIDGVRNYESQLNECFAREDCLAMCMYDRERFPAAVLDDILQHHPRVVADGRVMQNVYHVPPEEEHPQQTVERKLQTLRERTRAENDLEQRTTELQAAHNQLEIAASAGSVGLWTWDIQEDDLTADEYVAEAYGINPANAATGASIETFLEPIHDDDRDRVAEEVEEAIEHTGELDTEFRVGNANGDIMWLVSRGEVEYDDSEPLRLHGAITNITERKRQERLQAEQTQLVERIASGTPLEECLSSLCTTLSTLDPTVRASIVLTDDENQSFARCIAPDLSPSWREELEGLPIDERQIGTCGEAVFRGKSITCTNVETDDRWSDDWRELCLANDIRAGHSVPIHDTDGEPLGSVMLCFDEPKASTEWKRLADFGTYVASIALERERSRRALRESENRLRLATDAAEMGVWELDLRTEDSPDRSPQHDAIFGYEEREGWSLDTFLNHVHPDDRERIAQSFEDAFETGDWTFECRIIRADDEQRWITAQGDFYDDEEGEPVRAVGTVQDITERKERERELREQSRLEEFGAFVQAVEDYAIFMLDSNGDVTSWNEGAERIKGYTEDEIVGEHFSAFYTDADIDEGVPEANLETAAAEGHVEDEGWRVRKDGSQFWADVVITAIRDDNGTLQGFTKVTRDRTEQREYERQLRQERDFTEQIIETAPVGICSITPDGDFVRANQRALMCIGCEESDLADYSVDSWDLYDAEGDPIPTDEGPWTQVTETGDPVYDYQCQIDLPDIGRRWFSLNAAPLYDDQSVEASKTVIALEDITDRKQTTDALARLNTASRELMEAETQAITERAAGITQEVLDVASVSLWRYDEGTGDLQLHTASTAPGIDQAAIRYPDDFEDRAWRTFVSTEMDASNDFPPVSASGASETPIRSGVILPLGRHGILCAGSIRRDAFDETTVDFAETVAATIEAALDRANNEQQLARQNEALTQLDRINGIIRGIDQALVAADTREEIEQVVCERLAQSERYHSAWIGEYDLGTETLTPRDWAGIDASYFDDLTGATDDTALGHGPIGTAAQTHEVQIVEDIVTDARFAPWREQTLEYGARACIAIPLVYNDALYGVLTVYASIPQTETDDHAVLGELGQTIAYAINAVETKETLHTDSVVELELQFRDPDAPLCRFAQNADCQIAVEGFVPQANGLAHVFVTAQGASPEAIQTATESTIAIEELLCLSDREDESLFKVAVADPPLLSLLVEQDAVIRTLTIEDETATAVVDLPSTASVRAFVEDVQTQYPATDLRRRRTRDRSIDAAHAFTTTVDDRLTDRQQDILRTAYMSGFFQSPRERTGKEIAALLDISQPTFTQHLRAGQHNLFELLFDET